MNNKLLLCLLVLFILNACQEKENTPEPEFTQEDIETIDNQVVDYMAAYHVPGASVAITKDGRLVYKKGYGLADESTGEEVTANHRFRIASLSKTITSVMILKLMQDGKLTLEQRVFGEDGILGTKYGSEPYYPDLLKITVNDLLRHTSGGWRNYIDDPCFGSNDLSADELVSWALDNVKLAYEPGTHFHYSNFGYLLLGRIIEEITGHAYEDAVKIELLMPVGAAANMTLAGNKKSDRKSDEVLYYTQSELEDPYTTYVINRNDAPFGWISTPSDFLLLATAIDGFDSRPDLLNEETLAIMTTPAGFTANHARGIFIHNDPTAGAVWFHYGSLPGTHTLFFRSESGYCVAFMTNTRFDADYNGSSDAMSSMLLNIINDESIPWQDIDQFVR